MDDATGHNPLSSTIPYHSWAHTVGQPGQTIQIGSVVANVITVEGHFYILYRGNMWRYWTPAVISIDRPAVRTISKISMRLR